VTDFNAIYSTSWYNYVTKEYTTEPVVWRNAVPQDRASLGLYDVLTQHMGKSDIEAAQHVLELWCVKELP
jgi:hypothetical protein